MSHSTTNSGIYIIRNLKNGNFYIGQTNALRKRWREHRNALRSGKHHNSHLQAAWNLYGEKSFKFLVLEYCTVDQLDERERKYLVRYVDQQNCYNIGTEPSAAMRGRKFNKDHCRKIGEANSKRVVSAETRRKMSENALNRSAETRHKMSESQKGKTHSEESRSKMSEARRGEKNPNFGKSPSEEVRLKLSEANKGKHASAETRRKMSESHRNISEETRQRMRQASSGKTHTEETRQRMSEAAKRRWERERMENARNTDQEQPL